MGQGIQELLSKRLLWRDERFYCLHLSCLNTSAKTPTSIDSAYSKIESYFLLNFILIDIVVVGVDMLQRRHKTLSSTSFSISSSADHSLNFGHLNFA